ncbi:MAG: Redoxin domain protein [Pedosphaera sp.]|nr:Redoxin domain protein [Pedosphaera sp.]
MVTHLCAADLKVGDSFPDLAGFNLDGKLPEWKGKIVLVDFWASWCGPCKQSFPTMNELQKRYGEKGFVVIAINVDENSKDYEAFLRKMPAEFAVLRDSKQKLVAAVNAATMPTSFLLDTQGKVRHLHSGYKAKTREEYIHEIEALLIQPSPKP